MLTVLKVLIRSSTRRKCRKGRRGLQSHITRLRENVMLRMMMMVGMMVM
jgi:hypothetical protein